MGAEHGLQRGPSLFSESPRRPWRDQRRSTSPARPGPALDRDRHRCPHSELRPRSEVGRNVSAVLPGICPGTTAEVIRSFGRNCTLTVDGNWRIRPILIQAIDVFEQQTPLGMHHRQLDSSKNPVRSIQRQLFKYGLRLCNVQHAYRQASSGDLGGQPHVSGGRHLPYCTPALPDGPSDWRFLPSEQLQSCWRFP